MVNTPQTNEKIRPTRKINPSLKLLLDFAPLGMFFIAYKLGGLMAATVAIMVATTISVAVMYIYERTIPPAPLISGGLVLVMGILTVVLKDPVFIKIKPTLVNLAFAVILLLGVYGFRRGLLKHILDVAFHLTDEGWRVLSRRWGFFFLFLAVLNECVWRNFSEEFWVNFKVFGMFTLTVVFAIAQVGLVKKYEAQ